MVIFSVVFLDNCRFFFYHFAIDKWVYNISNQVLIRLSILDNITVIVLLKLEHLIDAFPTMVDDLLAPFDCKCRLVIRGSRIAVFLLPGKLQQ